ncbi:uncharacterized protein MONBRDRAFT_29870 [Monosiga brevicollis MX1]|uniref:Uncharacterized protein n=1 Tax=Monosiga brevicollis TaxID=81824 RepID=A9VCD1_MONBE|nr:uncharacterized protein MONBRDRAFT_29870 [Monosiga brevicollis MX1]EDQ84838.1 predicted protein [Monosiga brevicollis MX1]|eukprot:XP_001750339.1 hypothetical protein [Monosiga brevicollis MX1]
MDEAFVAPQHVILGRDLTLNDDSARFELLGPAPIQVMAAQACRHIVGFINAGLSGRVLFGIRNGLVVGAQEQTHDLRKVGVFRSAFDELCTQRLSTKGTRCINSHLEQIQIIAVPVVDATDHKYRNCILDVTITILDPATQVDLPMIALALEGNDLVYPIRTQAGRTIDCSQHLMDQALQFMRQHRSSGHGLAPPLVGRCPHVLHALERLMVTASLVHQKRSQAVPGPSASTETMPTLGVESATSHETSAGKKKPKKNKKDKTTTKAESKPNVTTAAEHRKSHDKLADPILKKDKTNSPAKHDEQISEQAKKKKKKKKKKKDDLKDNNKDSQKNPNPQVGKADIQSLPKAFSKNTSGTPQAQGPQVQLAPVPPPQGAEDEASSDSDFPDIEEFVQRINGRPGRAKRLSSDLLQRRNQGNNETKRVKRAERAWEPDGTYPATTTKRSLGSRGHEAKAALHSEAVHSNLPEGLGDVPALVSVRSGPDSPSTNSSRNEVPRQVSDKLVPVAIIERVVQATLPVLVQALVGQHQASGEDADPDTPERHQLLQLVTRRLVNDLNGESGAKAISTTPE